MYTVVTTVIGYDAITRDYFLSTVQTSEYSHATCYTRIQRSKGEAEGATNSCISNLTMGMHAYQMKCEYMYRVGGVNEDDRIRFAG